MNDANLTPVRSHQESSRGAPAWLCIVSALSLSLVSVWATPLPASGQQASGSYTNAQAEAGATVYEASCSRINDRNQSCASRAVWRP